MESKIRMLYITFLVSDISEAFYLDKMGPDLVHGAHLNVSQVLDQHDHFFDATPLLQHFSLEIVEVQLELLFVSFVKSDCQEVIVLKPSTANLIPNALDVCGDLAIGVCKLKVCFTLVQFLSWHL